MFSSCKKVTTSSGQSLFGGIEGGASHTIIALLTADGTVVAEAEGPASNHWLIGVDECAKRINDLTNAAKKKAGLDLNFPLKSLGMCLSGGDHAEACEKIRQTLKTKYPNLSKYNKVYQDTSGSIATGCEAGGVVLIAGTGSTCEVLNPDGSQHRVGGWGHFVGDDGSAFWISHYVIKKIFDTLDNFESSPPDITFAYKTMCEHFGVKDRMGMLDPFYSKFDKTFYAAMCKELARGAIELKDPLCLEAFHEAGKKLGCHVLGLGPKIDQSLLQANGGLHVVCVGSVFKSWSLLKEGFVKCLKPRHEKDIKISEISLLKLTKPGTVGAALLGSKAAGLKISMDYSQNASVFFHEKLQVE